MNHSDKFGYWGRIIFVIFAILLILSLILQVAILGRFKIFGILPNLVLIILILGISLQEKNKSFLVANNRVEFFKNCLMILPYSLMAGLILDALSGLPFGAIAFSLSVSVLLIYIFFYRALSNFNLFYAFFLIFLATLFYYICLWFFIHPQIDYLFIINIIKEAIFNAILAFMFYALQRSRKIFY